MRRILALAFAGLMLAIVTACGSPADVSVVAYKAPHDGHTFVSIRGTDPFTLRTTYFVNGHPVSSRDTYYFQSQDGRQEDIPTTFCGQYGQYLGAYGYTAISVFPKGRYDHAKFYSTPTVYVRTCGWHT